MESKHYTPEVREFRIGFRYEEFVPKQWVKIIARPKDLGNEWVVKYYNTSTSLSKITKAINDGKIRVKVLDEADIVEAGWGLDKYLDTDTIVITYKIKEWYLNLWLGEKKLVEIGNDENEIGFFGTIRNYNELLDVMRMLNIKK